MADSSLTYKITADIDDLKKQLQSIRQEFTQTSTQAEREGNKIDDTFKKIATAAGTFFTAKQAAGFMKQMASVRGEFQQLEVAFSTMLQSKDKANSLMKEVINLAATTPFDVQQVSNGAKQLLAYGSEAANVADEMTRLGNIAAGLSLPLNDMVYLYGTTRTQGRLFTQDLRQFMGRGIPIAEELAKQFGVTKDKVGELVTAGKIGFPEVEKAIKSMTDEGGKFYNLMAEQSKTISGQISNLEDAIQQMFNNLGKKSEGIISGAISMASALVENYEAIGKILMNLVAVYGTYKAAVLASIAVEKIKNGMLIAEMTGISKMSGAMRALITSEKQLQAAELATAKTLSLNPYAAVAAAIVGATIAIAHYINKQNESAKAQREWEEGLNKGVQQAKNIQKRFNELSKAAKDAIPGTEEFTKALKALGDEYPEFATKFDALSKPINDEVARQKALVSTLEEVQEKYVKAAKARAIFATYQSKMNELESDRAALQDKTDNYFYHYGKESHFWGMSNKDMEQAKKDFDDFIDDYIENGISAWNKYSKKLEGSSYTKGKNNTFRTTMKFFKDDYLDELNAYRRKAQSVSTYEKKYIQSIESGRAEEANEERKKKDAEEATRRAEIEAQKAEEAKKAADALNKAKERYNEVKTAFEEKTQKLQQDFSVETMDNAFQKGIAKINQHYDELEKELSNEYTKLEELAKTAEETLDKSVVDAYNNGLQTLQKQRSNAQDAYTKGYVDEIKSYIWGGKSDLLRNVDSATKEYAEVVARIDSLDDAVADKASLKSEAITQYCERLKQLSESLFNKDVQDITRFQMQDLENLVKGMKGGADVNEDLLSRLGIDKAFVSAYKSVDGSAENLEELLSKLLEAFNGDPNTRERDRSNISHGYSDPMAAFSGSLKEYKESKDALERLRASIDATPRQIAEASEVFKQATEDLDRSLHSIIATLTNAVIDMAKNTANLYKNLWGDEDEDSALSDMLGGLGDVVSNFVSGNYFGSLLSFISTGVTMAMKSMAGEYGGTLKYTVDEMRTLQAEWSDGVYIFKKGTEAYVSSMEKNIDWFNKNRGKLSGGTLLSNAESTLGDLDSQRTNIIAMIETLQGYIDEANESGRNKSNKQKEQIKEWQETIEALWGEYGDIDDMADSIRDAVANSILGFSSLVDMAHEFSSTFVSAFIEGKDEAAAVGNVLRDALINSAISMVQDNVGWDFSQIGEQIMLGLLDDNKLSDEEMEGIEGQMNYAVDKARAAVDAMKPLFDMISELGEASDRSGLSKGIEGMSQETATELNGRFTAIQGFTAQMADDVEALRHNSAEQLYYLNRIHINTEQLTQIKNDINYLRQNGISIN